MGLSRPNKGGKWKRCLGNAKLDCAFGIKRLLAAIHPVHFAALTKLRFDLKTGRLIDPARN